MRLGRWVLMREHPSERQLRKWGQLTPELRELIAKGVRSIAKDAVQEVVESLDIPFSVKKKVIHDTQDEEFWSPANIERIRKERRTTHDV